MPGDITRDTFDPDKHYSAVLMQQGRVQTDADWNEQGSIIRHQTRAFVADFLGPHCGFGSAFKIRPLKKSGVIIDLEIAAGHYYVDGILCENPGRKNADGTVAPATFFAQRDFPLDRLKDGLPEHPYLVYIDVWERDITALEDPALPDPALGGVDTTTRLKVIWQVRAAEIPRGVRLGRKNYGLNRDTAEEMIRQFTTVSACGLRVRVQRNQERGSTSAPPSPSGYLGAENHLYRVQIHSGGTAEPGNPEPATFKWSRENGSPAVPIVHIGNGGGSGPTSIEVAQRAGGSSEEIAPGDWVELLDDEYVLLNLAEPLLRVVSVENAGSGHQKITFNTPMAWVPRMDRCPILRRWDQRERAGLSLSGGVIPVAESDSGGSDIWIPLENGIEIQFAGQGRYRSGDYWLIAARTAIADVLWPRESDGTPQAKPPDGIVHHYAPLAIVSARKTNRTRVVKVTDCRSEVKPLSKLKP